MKQRGICFFIEETLKTSGTRHGRTYTKGHTVANDPKGYFKMTPKQALEFDLENLRDIYKEDGLYDLNIEFQILKVKALLRSTYPDVF